MESFYGGKSASGAGAPRRAMRAIGQAAQRTPEADLPHRRPVPVKRSHMVGSCSKSRPGGFTLIEVLVAFAIAALSLATLMRIFGTGLESARISEAQSRATMVAESRLAAIGVERPLVVGESAGETEDGYRWRVVASPLADDAAAPVIRYEVTVVVAWGPEGERERDVALHTLRLAARP